MISMKYGIIVGITAASKCLKQNSRDFMEAAEVTEPLDKAKENRESEPCLWYAMEKNSPLHRGSRRNVSGALK